MYTINDLLDLSKTIAAPLFEGKTYPWEVLADISDYIIALGSTLPEEEYEKRGENVAVMVDGPNGPAKKVKKGIISLAKHTGAPIIPMNWYSPSKHMIRLSTWDRLQFPVGIVKIANCYSEPIYVPKDATPEQEKEILQKIEDALNKLDENAPEIYKKLWEK